MQLMGLWLTHKNVGQMSGPEAEVEKEAVRVKQQRVHDN